MKRSLSTIEEQADGWRNFERLDQQTERFSELLDKYKLQVQHGSSQVWVATLLPYELKHSVVPEVRRPGIFQSMLLKLLPRQMKTKVQTDFILAEYLRERGEQIRLQNGIKSDDIDGYYCALTGPHVQDCIERLLENVESNERYTHLNAHSGPGGCTFMGWALAYETDTIGQYLMKGTLHGSKEGGSIVLNTEHPSLPGFSFSSPNFRDAYHGLR